MTTIPCSTCRNPVLIEGKGAKDTKAHLLTYARNDGTLHVCTNLVFCSKDCSMNLLNKKVA